LDWSHVVPVLQIIGIDLVLSGDNAVVIAMAAHRLPPKQRKLAFLFGAGGAIVLRIIATIAVSLLLKVPLLLFFGGAVLTWIAFQLLLEEEEAEHHVGPAESLGHAIRTIMVADFIMSLDNMLAVAGAGREHPALIVFGLLFSIVIIMSGGAVIANMMNKYPALILIGAGVLAWTAGTMIVEDPMLRDRVLFREPAQVIALSADAPKELPWQYEGSVAALRSGQKVQLECSGEEKKCESLVRRLVVGQEREPHLRGLKHVMRGETPSAREGNQTTTTLMPRHVADKLLPLIIVVLVVGGARLFEKIRWRGAHNETERC